MEIDCYLIYHLYTTHMIKLQEQFSSASGGFQGSPLIYKQFIRSDNAAVYERFNPDGTLRDYETFKIKILPNGTVQKFPNNIVKVTTDDEELYPSTGQFSKTAWSFHGVKGKEGALKKYELLNNSAVKSDDVSDDVSETTEIIDIEPVISIGRRGRAPKERHELKIPDGEFTTNDLTEFNQVDRNDAVFYINQELGKKIQFIGEKRIGENKRPSKIYKKI